MVDGDVFEYCGVGVDDDFVFDDGVVWLVFDGVVVVVGGKVFGV